MLICASFMFYIHHMSLKLTFEIKQNNKDQVQLQEISPSPQASQGQLLFLKHVTYTQNIMRFSKQSTQLLLICKNLSQVTTNNQGTKLPLPSPSFWSPTTQLGSPRDHHLIVNTIKSRHICSCFTKVKEFSLKHSQRCRLHAESNSHDPYVTPTVPLIWGLIQWRVLLGSEVASAITSRLSHLLAHPLQLSHLIIHNQFLTHKIVREYELGSLSWFIMPLAGQRRTPMNFAVPTMGLTDRLSKESKLQMKTEIQGGTNRQLQPNTQSQKQKGMSTFS